MEMSAEIYMVTVQTCHIYLKPSLSLNSFVHPFTAVHFIFSVPSLVLSLSWALKNESFDLHSSPAQMEYVTLNNLVIVLTLEKSLCILEVEVPGKTAKN